MSFEDDLQDRSTPVSQEREISLGTGTILAIFFALTLICGVFFGFGYSMGRRSEKAAIANIPPANPVLAEKSGPSAFSNFKAASVATSAKTPAADTRTVPESPSAADTTKATPSDSTATPAAESTVVQPPADPDGTWMVQVSATTRKPDAEALSKVLVRQGFTTMIRPDADQKFHVRVGPFTAKKDADITRKLLVASGYKDPFITQK